MATNRIYESGTQFPAPVAEGTESGDAILLGDALPAVALTDRGADGNAAGYATVQTDGVFLLPIVTASGAVEVGDIIYITSGGDLTRTVGSNVRFGYALGELDTNTAGSIPVKIGY